MSEPWKIEYGNDTGPNDDCFIEWWDVTNGEKSYRCTDKDDAEWLMIYVLFHQKEQLLTTNAAFKEIEAQRNSLVTEVGKLRSTLEKAESAFLALQGTWLVAMHRCDMNKEMDHLQRIFARKWRNE